MNKNLIILIFYVKKYLILNTVNQTAKFNYYLCSV